MQSRVPEPILAEGQQEALRGQITTEIPFKVGSEVFYSIDSIDPPEDDTYIYEIIPEN